MESGFVLAIIFAFIIIITWMSNINKERMFLLKQGKDPNIIETKLPKTSSTNYLKWGIIIVGIGLGALFGTLCSDGQYSLYLSFLMIFTGISLVVSFIVVKKQPQTPIINKEEIIFKEEPAKKEEPKKELEERNDIDGTTV